MLLCAMELILPWAVLELEGLEEAQELEKTPQNITITSIQTGLHLEAAL